MKAAIDTGVSVVDTALVKSSETASEVVAKSELDPSLLSTAVAVSELDTPANSAKVDDGSSETVEDSESSVTDNVAELATVEACVAELVVCS